MPGTGEAASANADVLRSPADDDPVARVRGVRRIDRHNVADVVNVAARNHRVPNRLHVNAGVKRVVHFHPFDMQVLNEPEMRETHPEV